MLTVLKLGGELLDDAAATTWSAAAVARLAVSGRLVVVHGAGRAIDAEMRRRNLEPLFVDGLRVTDAAALDAVVSVLCRTNASFVAALRAAGVAGVGLTGADAGVGLCARAPLFTSAAGACVDLGLVGEPLDTPLTLLQDLTALGYVPAIASIGITATGELLNVNADTLAGHLAAALRADRLIVAGATAGVLDGSGRTIGTLTMEAVDTMVDTGQAHSGMVAKLAACRKAVLAGVDDVSIVAGRGVTDLESATGTRLVVPCRT